MFEFMLLAQKSALLNNSGLAAEDILINWKGRRAQNAAEAFWSQKLGLKWNEDCSKWGLKSNHYISYVTDRFS